MNARSGSSSAVAGVDFLLQLGDSRIVDLSLCEMIVHLLEIGRGEQGAQI